MKKLSFIFFLFTSLVTYSQDNSALSLFFMPTDCGIGLRYDNNMGNLGFYISADHGKYRYCDGSVITNHYRTSSGPVYYFHSPYYSMVNIFYCGIVIHRFGPAGELSGRVLKPVSFEIGTGGKMGRFLVGFIYDPLRKEGGIFTGIYF